MAVTAPETSDRYPSDCICEFAFDREGRACTDDREKGNPFVTQKVVYMPPLSLSPGCCDPDMPLYPFEAARSLRRTRIDMPAAWKCQVPEGTHLDGAGPVEQYEAVNTFFHRNVHFRDRSFGSVHVLLQYGGHHPVGRVPRVLDKDP
jgi:hypothetical protein